MTGPERGALSIAELCERFPDTWRREVDSDGRVSYVLLKPLQLICPGRALDRVVPANMTKR